MDITEQDKLLQKKKEEETKPSRTSFSIRSSGRWTEPIGKNPPKQKSLAVRIFGVVYLTCCVVGGAMIGPVSNLVAPTSAGLKNSWRAGILIIYFLIPFLVEMKYNNWERYKPFFNWKAYGSFLCLILCQVIW